MLGNIDDINNTINNDSIDSAVKQKIPWKVLLIINQPVNFLDLRILVWFQERKRMRKPYINRKSANVFPKFKIILRLFRKLYFPS